MADKKIKRQELTIDDLRFDSVTAISLVDFPAFEVNWEMFNKKQANVTLAKTQDKDQQIIVGPALISNKDVYRFDMQTGEESYVWFSEETVKEAAHQFLKDKNNSNVTMQHQVALNNVSVVESWYAQNPVVDRAFDLGFRLDTPTWMVAMQIPDNIWAEFIKSEEVKGFSIEGFFTQNFMLQSKEDLILQQLKDIFKN